jgi:hypothetical protein
MGMGVLDEVVQTSTVPRNKATLARAPITGAYLRSSEERRAQAWCFISRQGDISSVYVRPEARGGSGERDGSLSWHMFRLRTWPVSGCVNR